MSDAKSEVTIEYLNERYESLSRDIHPFVWAINEAIKWGEDIHIRVGHVTTVVRLDEAKKVRAHLR